MRGSVEGRAMLSVFLTLPGALAASAAGFRADEATLSQAWRDLRQTLPAPGLRKASFGFHPPDRFPGRSVQLAKALEAVVELDSGYSRCAGVYISNAGHILTAAHCFRDHLSEASRFTAADLAVLEHRQGVTFYEKTIPEIEVGGAPVVLVAAGKGVLSHLYSPPDIGRLSGDAGMIARLGAAASGDWAIVKARPSSSAGCVGARSDPLEDGEPLWAAGYPGPAGRPDGLGSSGHDGLRVTSGEKDSDITASRWLDTVDAQSREVFSGIYQPEISKGNIFLSSIDSFKGMSGGPLMDGNGRVAGVVTASGHTNKRFFDKSTIGISVQGIREELRRHSPGSPEFFDCR